MLNLRLDACPPELRERLEQGIKDLADLGRQHGDGRDWARRIIKKVHDGIRVSPTTLAIACDALGIRDVRKAGREQLPPAAAGGVANPQ